MSDAEPRRRPQQERSKSRVEAILDIALGLIIEVGAEEFAMREVARRVGVPISSVYQYFPSKTAIIRELAKRNFEHAQVAFEKELATLLVETNGRPTVERAVDRLVEAHYDFQRENPAAHAIWAAAQADPVLRALDVTDTKRSAELITPLIMIVLAPMDPSEAFALALLFAEVTSGTVRLALAVASPLRDQMIGQLKVMMIAMMETVQRKHGRQ
ncbi:TetR/AcrR family transcriptional regulator [Telmatospirillum sp.]|uniref:TetR/AcrR family transcriptional regulator n=1 Tax=Telmatospirillum sp. TaxID=2079197 RepID=UPI0028454A4F|nr:TetR/AcrR family transcriptional regulator [Telmatospirillum sp.]MDR3438745.1 TetR/AcrR family transcriptional regulator [Telmatospirillum sp.]